jgi:hypothetical protein
MEREMDFGFYDDLWEKVFVFRGRKIGFFVHLSIAF